MRYEFLVFMATLLAIAAPFLLIGASREGRRRMAIIDKEK